MSPPFPRRNWSRIFPQPDPVRLSALFLVPIHEPFVRRLLVLVLLVVPGHPSTDLLQPNVTQADEHGAHLAAEAVFLVAARLYPLLEDERR
jgi:hypothetical protein